MTPQHHATAQARAILAVAQTILTYGNPSPATCRALTAQMRAVVRAHEPWFAPLRARIVRRERP